MDLSDSQNEIYRQALAVAVDDDDCLRRWFAAVEFVRAKSNSGVHNPDVGNSGLAKPPIYRRLWEEIFSGWNAAGTGASGPAPIWIPSVDINRESNVGRWMAEQGFAKFFEFHRWSIKERGEFWGQAAAKVNVQFRQPPSSVLDTSQGVTKAAWFSDARLNIVESCFQARESDVAIVARKPGRAIRQITYGDLRRQANRVSNSLVDAGFKVGDAIAVVLPMTAWSIPIYLGIVQAGCMVVSIADSFAPPEIASRLEIAGAKMVFTYDCQIRAGKKLPLFKRVEEATDLPVVVLSAGECLDVDLRNQDFDWGEFLVERDEFEPIEASAQETINVLFSSGTTGDPKAIPWNHLTPVKCAVDGYIHQDIRPGDVCAWPTNLGWMMGPWLIFASLMNEATIALYEDAPMGAGFGEFIQDAAVTMLGVVPTIVKAWRASGEMELFDWSAIRVFSSTGESSQRDDMVYLSSLADIKPIIEYCGGTEIGGGYVTSVVVEPNIPAVFNTPAAGSEFLLLDEEHEIAEEGEVFLVPPTIGLSSRLVNRDHHATYYADVPNVDGYQQLRRHGDHFRRLAGSVYVAGGRVDDTMNLGGIKISSAEIERVLNAVDGVKETAAVAVNLDAGPTSLVVFVVLTGDEGAVSESLTQAMNVAIKSNLNPLFKISQLVLADSLPRTASGKVMRRKLRDRLAT